MIHETITPSIQPLREPYKDAFEALNNLVKKDLTANHPNIDTASSPLINPVGKRIRSLLSFIIAGKQATHSHITLLTGMIECLHLATLIHDDVIDESELRRHQPTLHVLMGNHDAILCGDYLLATAFKWQSAMRHHDFNDYMATVLQNIVIGELNQSNFRHNISVSQAEYEDVIYRKTALLFEASCYGSALLLELDNPDQYRNFGRHFGMAYQMIDDYLDYYTENDNLDKNTLDDWHNGTPTLPLILALQHYPDIRTEVKQTFGQHNCPEKVLDFIKVTQPLSENMIQQQINTALEALSHPSEQLKQLCQWLKHRTH